MKKEMSETMHQHAASYEPYFAMVGGDLAYANNMPGCYLRWDQWLYNWGKYMVTPSGFLLPMISAIGNHESGGVEIVKNYFYTYYFPQSVATEFVFFFFS